MEATYIGKTNDDLSNGKIYNVSIEKMHGRIYKPEKDQNGWLDKEGVPDNRFMVYSASAYKGEVPYLVYDSAEDVVKDWKPSNWNDVQATTLRSQLPGHLKNVLV